MPHKDGSQGKNGGGVGDGLSHTHHQLTTQTSQGLSEGKASVAPPSADCVSHSRIHLTWGGGGVTVNGYGLSLGDDEDALRLWWLYSSVSTLKPLTYVR